MTVARATAAGLAWEAVAALSDEELEGKLYEGPAGGGLGRPLPDFAAVHAEHKAAGRDARSFCTSSTCSSARAAISTRSSASTTGAGCKRRRLSMRQIHRAGEKLFVDYAGKRPEIIDAATGEATAVELFVAVARRLEPRLRRGRPRRSADPDSLARPRCAPSGSSVAVAAAVVPALELKSGVTTACRYEPGVQRAYEELAQHYGTVILPARPGKPRDKAKVEVAVQLAERWILARLRHETFFSLAALNVRIRELLGDLNARTMRAYGASRQELFERLDRPALRPLPTERFVHAEWKKARVNLDYHVELDHHYYSVPHVLVHEAVELRFTATTVARGLRPRPARGLPCPQLPAQPAHPRILPHMPKAHQKHLSWTPSRLLHWAQSIGPQTAALVEAILTDRPHPEQGYRSCLGILRLAKRYGAARLEAASTRAVAARARSYRHVDSILKRGLDRLPWPAHGVQTKTSPVVFHENVRGGDYCPTASHERTERC